jgi:hypothetical protein
MFLASAWAAQNRISFAGGLSAGRDVEARRKGSGASLPVVTQKRKALLNFDTERTGQQRCHYYSPRPNLMEGASVMAQCESPSFGTVRPLSTNGSGIVGAYLASFLLLMEKILAKCLGQDLGKLAVQKKRLMLPRFLARLAPEIRNPLSSLDTHAELLEGDLAELGPPAKEKLVGRLEMIQGEVHSLENISQQFLRLWMEQQIVTPHGGSNQTANAPGGGAVFSAGLLL